MEKSIKLHGRAITILRCIERRKIQIDHYKKCIEIEDRKPAIEAYLFASLQWFLTEIHRCEIMILRFKIRHIKLLRLIQETIDNECKI